MKVTKPEPGHFCWAELSTSDGKGAKAFYSELMGWEAHDDPIGPDMVYTMLRTQGAGAAALYEDREGKTPPHWGVYVCTDNVEQTAERARELGGTVLMEPFDVMEHGRMAVIQDPTGAVLSVWQPKGHIGYQVIGEPRAACWHELTTPDAKRAEAFYTGLFGYSAKPSEMPFPYTELQQDGQSVAGVMSLPDKPEVPAYWNVYFMVENCIATFEKAVQLGASELIAPQAVPGVGTMAMIRDPQGAVFAFIATNAE